MYRSCAVGAESCGESYQLSEYCMTRFETVADSSRIWRDYARARHGY